MEVGTLKHRHLLTMQLKVDAAGAAMIGATPKGHRSIVPVLTGDFKGDRLAGKVLGGSDWVLSTGADRMEIDVRLNLETDDGAKIYLTYQGRFHGEEGTRARLAKGETISDEDFTLATVAKFECGDPRYAWLNDVIAVGTGSQSGFNPTYQIFEIG